MSKDKAARSWEPYFFICRIHVEEAQVVFGGNAKSSLVSWFRLGPCERDVDNRFADRVVCGSGFILPEFLFSEGSIERRKQPNHFRKPSLKADRCDRRIVVRMAFVPLRLFVAPSHETAMILRLQLLSPRQFALR